MEINGYFQPVNGLVLQKDHHYASIKPHFRVLHKENLKGRFTFDFNWSPYYFPAEIAAKELLSFQLILFKKLNHFSLYPYVPN